MAPYTRPPLSARHHSDSPVTLGIYSSGKNLPINLRVLLPGYSDALAFELGLVDFQGSLEQVRRPVYSSSVGRWKNYEQELQPLIDELGLATD